MSKTVMPRVLVDVDGVLAQYIRASLLELGRVCGPRDLVEDTAPEWNGWPETFPSWDMFDVFPDERERLVLLDLWYRKGFCRGLEPFPGAQEGITKLQRVAHVVAVTTSMYSPWWHTERTEWLQEHFNIGEGDLIFTPRVKGLKHPIDGDLFIDDKTSTVRTWAAHHPDKQAVLWRRTYNENDVVPGALHTNDWDQVVEAARALA